MSYTSRLKSSWSSWSSGSEQKKRFYAVGVEPEPEEILDQADALNSQLCVHDDGEGPSTLLKSGTEENLLQS